MKKSVITKGIAELKKTRLSVKYSETVSDRIELSFDIGMDEDDYVFFPAAVYGGNKGRVKYLPYPPAFDPKTERFGADMPRTITDVPRLESDGSGAVELTAGDVSVPCVGVFRRAQRRAYFVWTVQQAHGENLGLAYEGGSITLSCPARRRKVYTMCRLADAQPKTSVFRAGEQVDIPYRYRSYPCESIEEFFRLFLRGRTCMGLPVSPPLRLPRREIVQTVLRVYDEKKWCEELSVYTAAESFRTNKFSCWQSGWIGGVIAAYAMLALGNKKQRDRGRRTLDFLFSLQTEAGLFYHGCDVRGERYGSGFCEGTERWLLARVAGDILLYALKAVNLLSARGENCAGYDERLRRFADALCGIFERYGQFGYVFDCETAEIAVYGSTSGAVIPAALCAAYARYQNERYLSVACKSAQAMYERDALAGYTCGGPGDILQNTDAESACGLLESMVSLYETTGDAAWLGRARHAAAIAISWVVPYDYAFPAGSTFGRMGMHTAGTVFANVQNKHSAPGFCTYSGDALRRLSAYTGDKMYEKVYRSVAAALPQYLSTAARPIYVRGAGRDLPAGFINERVNMSDWEGAENVGEVFYGSCWSELTLLLTLIR